MNNFYTQTTLPTPVVDYKAFWPNDPTDKSDSVPRWQKFPLDVAKKTFWTDQIRSRLASQGLVPTVVRIFRWCPHGNFTWHVDGTATVITNFAINWILDGSGIIQWNSKLELPPPPAEHSHLAYGCIYGKDSDFYEAATSGHGCLVNTKIPHRVFNNSDVHRVTISIQFGNELTYDEALRKLAVLGYVK